MGVGKVEGHQPCWVWLRGEDGLRAPPAETFFSGHLLSPQSTLWLLLRRLVNEEESKKWSTYNVVSRKKIKVTQYQSE